MAGGWRQARGKQDQLAEITHFRSIESLCQAMVVMLVSSLWRDSHSTLLPIPLRILIRERGVAPPSLTISAEQRHQIDGTVSADHLHTVHSTRWRVIPRYGSHTSNIVDWLRLWLDSKRRSSQIMSDELSASFTQQGTPIPSYET